MSTQNAEIDSCNSWAESLSLGVSLLSLEAGEPGCGGGDLGRGTAAGIARGVTAAGLATGDEALAGIASVDEALAGGDEALAGGDLDRVGADGLALQEPMKKCSTPTELGVVKSGELASSIAT